MTKKVRIKNLEGYTANLEARIESLEGHVDRLRNKVWRSTEDVNFTRPTIKCPRCLKEHNFVPTCLCEDCREVQRTRG